MADDPGNTEGLLSDHARSFAVTGEQRHRPRVEINRGVPRDASAGAAGAGAAGKLRGKPRDFGMSRSTGTKRRLIGVMKRLTGTTLSRTKMGRLLKKLPVRPGRANPPGPCP